MATKRGDKSKHELVNLSYNKKEDDYIERLVLPTDSLQGIALLYNTSVTELKKLNHFHKDTDLHARRIIKVPAKGILIDLTDASAIPPLPPSREHNEDESDNESTNGEIYLSNVDTALQEIRDKVESVASNSVILQASSSEPSLTREDLMDLKNQHEDIAWWKVALPCFGVLIAFPFLYYLYREQLADLMHNPHTNSSSTPHWHSHY